MSQLPGISIDDLLL